MRRFFRNNAIKATVAVYGAGALLAWPPILSWMVAIGLLVYAARKFRDAFREMEAAKPASPPSPYPANVALAGGRDIPDIDVASVLIGAQHARPVLDAR